MSSASTTPSVADLEKELNDRRNSLTRDLEDLGERLSPTSLKTQARHVAEEAKDKLRARVSDAKQRAQELADEARDKAEDARTKAHDAVDSLADSAEPASVSDRIHDLLDDAADRDPRALAIVTGVAVALAGVAIFVMTKVARS